MIKSATEKYIKRNISGRYKVRVFYVKTDNKKDCAVVCSQTTTETVVSFITCIPVSDENKIYKVLSETKVPSKYQKIMLEKNSDEAVYIYSRRYARGVAYIHRAKNIEKTIYGGLDVVTHPLNFFNIKNKKKGEFDENR